MIEKIISDLHNLGTTQNAKIYQRHGAEGNVLGVGIGNLRKLKTKLYREIDNKIIHEYARELWKTKIVDARILCLLICDPKVMTDKEFDRYLKDITYYPMTDFVADLAFRSKFSIKKLHEWINLPDEMYRRAGYVTLGLMARKDENLDDEFFLKFVKKIEKDINKSANRAKEAMNNALIAIGMRNNKLRERILEAADKIGDIEIDYGKTRCKTHHIRECLNKKNKNKRYKLFHFR